MKSKRAPFEVARSNGALYVRICGLGSMTNAPTLEAFAEKALDDGVNQLVLDLKRCTGVDSTFMGMILALSNRLREQGGTSGIVLVNVDEHALKQLKSVGVDAFVTVKDGKSKLPGALRLTELLVAETTDRERLKLMVRAHKELVAADARNEAKFGAFLEGILAELE
jgi:anti-anti-sigma regulatory factor